MKDIDYFHYSKEAFFGNSNPLKDCLISGINTLQQLFNNPDSKKNRTQIKNHLVSFGDEVGKIINAEKFYFSISDQGINAYSFFLGANRQIRSVDKKTGRVTINEAFLSSLKGMVETDNGYRFKSSKNKICIVVLSIGLFDPKNNLSVGNIAAITAHEIGHCFESCVYDTIIASQERLVSYLFSDEINTLFPKSLYDSDVKIINKTINGEKHDVLEISNSSNITKTQSLPNEGEINYKRGFLPITTFLNVLRGVFMPFNVLVKNSMRKRFEIANEKSDTQIPINILMLANSMLDKSDNVEHIKFVRKDEDMNISRYYEEKAIPNRNRFIILQKLSVGLLDYVVKFVFRTLNNTINIITFQWLADLRMYRNKHYIAKYEHFADAFATSYGLGGELAESFKKMSSESSMFGRDPYTFRLLYDIPILSVVQYYADFLNYKFSVLRHQSHMSSDMRIRNIYSHLYEEMNRTGISQDIKDDITEQMQESEKQYNDLICGKSVRSITYRLFNKIMFNPNFKNVQNTKDHKQLKKYVLDVIEEQVEK